MQTFHFFPPSPAEQRSFTIQLFGTILTAIVAAFLAFRTNDAGLRATMIGLAIGAFFLLARTAFEMEIKARRAQNAEIGIGESGLKIVDEHGKLQSVDWQKIEKTEVVNGKLRIQWDGGEAKFSSREIENGMKLIQLIAAHTGSTPSAKSPSNFIPLSPK